MPAGKNIRKIACIFNYAPHYRNLIYNMMSKEFGCDFYFGANLTNGQQLKKMNFKILPGFKKESRVFRLLHEWQCNVVIQAFKNYQIYILTGHPSLSNIVFMVFAKIFNKKVFLWTHGFKRLEEGKHPLVRFFFNSATGFFLYGNNGKEMMVKYGIPKERLFVINNSLDYDNQLKVRKKLTSTVLYAEKFKNNDPVLIFTGRLQSEKKLHYIFKAMKELMPELPLNLILVGDGLLRNQLSQQVEQLRLVDRVWFFGACYDEEILGGLFYNATLTVSPGNIGLTAIHSMMYGTPILSHSTFLHQGPEFEAIKQGETGLLFKEDDVTDLTSKIKDWITNFVDRESIRQKCFRTVDDYYSPYYSLKVMKNAINTF